MKRMSAKDIAGALGLKEKRVRQFIEKQKVKLSATPSGSGVSKPAGKRIWIAVILIAVLGFGVYANSLQGEFVWDDEGLVMLNPYIKSWSYLGKIFVSSLGTSGHCDR